MSDDTPTVRFDQPQDGPGGPGFGGPGDPGGPTPGGPTPGEPGDGKKSHTLVIVLSIVGGMLLIAVIILLAVLFARGSGSKPTPTPTVTSQSPSPTPSQTPSQTPSPTPTKTTAPPSTAPAVGSFVVNTTTVQCPTANSTAPLSFSWTSTNASTAYFGIDTTDASVAPYFSNLPPNGSTANFPDQATNNPFQFTCSNKSHVYTITVVGNGQKASKSVTVTATQ